MANRDSITATQCSNDELLNQNISELGIQAHKPPVQPKYATFQSRLDTFNRWPADNPQNPESLATAGFYYCGPNDQVRCFHCNIGLCRWEPSDNPWVEHAKWYPSCGFVALVKRKEFIDQCVKNAAENKDIERRMGDVNVMNNIVRSVSGADVDSYMDSPCALEALKCGLQPERIRKAIRRKLLQTGTPFNHCNDLIEAALNVQVNETPFSVPDVTTPSQHASSSTRYPVDDAAIDHVTRMIINSALSGDNLEHSSLTSSTNSWESENDNEIANDDRMEILDVQNENNLENEQCNSEDQLKTNESCDELLNSTDSLKTVEKTINHNLLLEENKLLRDARTCKICMDSEVNVVFLPCGHLVSCMNCAVGLIQCPICRANVKGIVRTYMS